jgi:hypothetical protein
MVAASGDAQVDALVVTAADAAEVVAVYVAVGAAVLVRLLVSRWGVGCRTGCGNACQQCFSGSGAGFGNGSGCDRIRWGHLWCLMFRCIWSFWAIFFGNFPPAGRIYTGPGWARFGPIGGGVAATFRCFVTFLVKEL